MQDIIESHDVVEGWYGKPHCLILKVRLKMLTKSEYIFLDLLLHFENKYTNFPNSWFFVADKNVCETRLISPKTVIRTRKNLKRKGIIDCRTGHSRKATEYKILIDASLYYRGGLSLERRSELRGSLL